MIAQQPPRSSSERNARRETSQLKQLVPLLVVVASVCLSAQLTKCDQHTNNNNSPTQQVPPSKQQEDLANSVAPPPADQSSSAAATATTITSTTANSISQQQQANGGPLNNAAAPGGSLQQQQQQQQRQQLAPPKLPKINVFISKNEIKKLLGIDARINYVTNGNINTYPFGFTIPMGYNQSDIIFTWQNLSPTNVNYSISLVIGNIQAVDPPLINITRSGLIPRHEQVFKITLPCSGKVTDEVDVQVLINIMGTVPVSQLDGEYNFAAAGDDGASPSGAAEHQQFGDMQLAAAMRQQQQDQNSSAAASSAPDGTTSGMQSDEPQQQQQYRLVSHTLAIKRKKICTMHPVPIQPEKLAKVRPANQQPSAAHKTTTAAAAAATENRWQSGGEQHNHSPAPMDADVAQPAHHPALATTNGGGGGGGDPSNSAYDQDHHNRQRQPSGSSKPTIVGPNATRRPVDQQQQQTASPASAGNFAFSSYPNWPSRLPAPATNPNSVLPPTPIPPENPLNELLLRNQPAGTAVQNLSTTSAASGGNQTTLASTNPLLLTLMLMSLIISVALVVLVMLSSTSATSPSSLSSSWSDTKRQPFDKLNALTSCLLRRAPASCSRAQTKSSPIKTNGIIGPLRVSRTAQRNNLNSNSNNGAKSSASSISGLSAIVSGGGSTCSPAKAAYCFKWNNNQLTSGSSNNNNGNTNYSSSGYYTNSYHPQQQQQHYSGHLHHYQLPPTADLLGTGYQCQPAAPQSNNNNNNNNNYPIYHIATGNTNQTTRLIWNNGNGTSPDGFTIDGGSYMPLSNAPRSDSGSLYQTISG